MSAPEPASPRIERLPDVLRRVGLSRSTWYARVKAGLAPRPIPLGSPHCVGYLSVEIDEFILAQVRAARPEPAATA